MSEKSTEARSPQAAKAAEVIQSILRAKKNLRLYPTNNPMHKKIVEETFKKVVQFFELKDVMNLVFTRNEITLEGETVYSAEGTEENFALFFFRDGLRTMDIDSGITIDEFQGLLTLLSVDFDSEEVEDDLITLLWEKDFDNIKYKVDESILVDEDQYESQAIDQAKEGASSDGSISQAFEKTNNRPEISGIMPIAITEKDLEHLELEIEKDRLDKMPKLTDILFDMLYFSDSMEEFREISRIIMNAVDFCIRMDNLASALRIFKRVKHLVASTKSENVRNHLTKVLAYAGSPSVVSKIGVLLEQKDGINKDDFKDYISYLDSSAIPPLLQLLGELKSISARKSTVQALSVVGRSDLTAIAKGLSDDKWYVVRNVVLILRQIKDKKAMELMLKVAEHEDPRVRKEVLRAMAEHGGPLGEKAARAALADKDLSVNYAAFYALGKIASQYSVASMLEYINTSEFQNLDIDEMKPYFEVIARVRSRIVYQFLIDILDKNPLFGRSKFNEYKACAIYALGLMGQKDSLEKLEPLLGSKYKLLSDYAATAIKRINLAAQRR